MTKYNLGILGTADIAYRRFCRLYPKTKLLVMLVLHQEVLIKLINLFKHLVALGIHLMMN